VPDSCAASASLNGVSQLRFGDVVGFYSRYILPRLIDLAMRNRETTRLRASWIPQAQGRVLEVGIGSGLNVPFYSDRVEHIFGVDPSLELQRIAKTRADGHLNVDFLPQSAEQTLPLMARSAIPKSMRRTTFSGSVR